MPYYQVIDHYRIGADHTEVCIIERALPGERSVYNRFAGSWAKAEKEATRLNTLARVSAQALETGSGK
jgi:hypothetical protein